LAAGQKRRVFIKIERRIFLRKGDALQASGKEGKKVSPAGAYPPKGGVGPKKYKKKSRKMRKGAIQSQKGNRMITAGLWKKKSVLVTAEPPERKSTWPAENQKRSHVSTASETTTRTTRSGEGGKQGASKRDPYHRNFQAGKSEELISQTAGGEFKK